MSVYFSRLSSIAPRRAHGHGRGGEIQQQVEVLGACPASATDARGTMLHLGDQARTGTGIFPQRPQVGEQRRVRAGQLRPQAVWPTVSPEITGQVDLGARRPRP